MGSVDSTQRLLRERLTAGEPVHGLVLRAYEQSAGRGRHGRRFASPPGGSYQSLAVDPLRCGFDLERADLVAPALAFGVGVAEVFGGYGARLAVKWPNDLFYLGRKLGGILTERVRGHLLVGIGMNVNNPVPVGATALRGWDLDGVHGAVLAGVQVGLELLAAGGGVAARFAAVDALAGREVVIELERGERVTGRADGVDARGRLRLLGGSGVVMVSRGSVVEIV